MKPGSIVKKIWGNPLAAGLNLEDPDHIHAHRKILQSNRLLHAAYERWYRQMLPTYEGTRGLSGSLIELGSGVGFLEQFIPELIKTDCVPNPFATRVLDAMAMDLPDESVRAFFLAAVFHHLSSPEKFLAEVQRCLQPGGRAVLIEPNNSFPQKALCRVLDHYEYFDTSPTDWSNLNAKTLEGANLATGWMVFVRDADLFDKRFPKLRISAVRYHTFAAYIISGGMSYRPFLPGFATPLLALHEWLLQPLGKWLATAMTVEITKIQ